MNIQDFPISSKQVVVVLQGHWISMLRHSGSFIIGWGLFGVCTWLAFVIRPASLTASILVEFLGICALVIAHHFFFIRIFEWLLSNVFITMQLIVNLHYISFAEDDIAYIEISKINEVEKRKHGLWQNILNYGEVVLSVAGMRTNAVFSYVKRPSKIVSLIQALKEQGAALPAQQGAILPAPMLTLS